MQALNKSLLFFDQNIYAIIGLHKIMALARLETNKTKKRILN